jgi:hypothetical protein
MAELPIGQVPDSAFIRMRTTGSLVHAWDLAKATGQPTDLDPELATPTLAASRHQHMTVALRDPGTVFGAPQPSAVTAGRQPIRLPHSWDDRWVSWSALLWPMRSRSKQAA